MSLKYVNIVHNNTRTIEIMLTRSKRCRICTKMPDHSLDQGGHGTGITGNLAVNFSRQGKRREFSKFNFLHRENCANTGKILKI